MNARWRRIRRGIPDNLGPLVDTLSNVVGILVMVIVVIQLELGDAVARVDAALEGANETRSRLAASRSELEARRARLVARTDSAPEAAIDFAEEMLAALNGLPTQTSASEDDAREEEEPPWELAARLAETSAALERERGAFSARADHASGLRSVPSRLVARLPNPELQRGYESWILVRYGRVFLVDREALYDAGSRAIQRLLGPAIARGVRPDEFESTALYLRKQAAGSDGFRWQLGGGARPRVELEFPEPDHGRMTDRLDRDPGFGAWLAARNPEQDFIRFHVWDDSFEAYAAARQATEQAGFRAGWVGHTQDEEMTLHLTFGSPLPRERTIEVD